MSLTPEQRRLRAQIGAHSLHAKHDSRELTLPARRAFMSPRALTPRRSSPLMGVQPRHS